jgi:hypothetical protein
MRRFQIGMIVLSAVALCSARGLADDSANEKPAEEIGIFGTATMKVPAAFKRTAAANRLIEHEFQAQAGEGKDAKTARVTMMAAGGDVAANIARWKGQFSGGDADAQKTEEMKVGKWQVHLVDVAGTYAESMGGGPFAPGRKIQRDDYAMAGAILVGADGRKYFIKMIGPAQVVKKNRESFVKMIKSIEK